MTQFDIRVMTVDSFTRCRFGGNPAAVIPDAEDIPQMYYPQIANEINLAQTTFLSEVDKDFYKLEFFSPSRMMTFSGHATIAAFFALGHMGYIRPIENGPKHVKAKLENDDILDLMINYDNYEAGSISIKIPDAKTISGYEDILSIEALRKILKINASDIEEISVVEAFQKDIFVFVKDDSVLKKIKLDPWGLKVLNEKTETVGLSVIYLSESDNPYAYCRYFAPCYGIFEEAATGSAAASIGSIILENLKKESITIYQGQSMKRPSRIVIEKIKENYYLTGECRMVTDGIMTI